MRGGARALIGALLVSGSEGTSGVTSVLREDILEEGTLSLADTRVFSRHLKSWQVLPPTPNPRPPFPFPRSLKSHVFELFGVCFLETLPVNGNSVGFSVYFEIRYTRYRRF